MADVTEMNAADLVARWKDTDDPREAAAIEAELRSRLIAEPGNAAVAAALAEVSGEPGPGPAGPQAGAGGAVEGRSQGEQTWLVQSHYTTTVDGEPRNAWLDVGEVTVPPRTKRKTIVEKALSLYPGAVPDKADDTPSSFRVLDTDSAAPIPVRWEVPPAPAPELVIG